LEDFDTEWRIILLWEGVLDSSGSRYGPVVDSLVDCNETWVP